MNKVFFSVLLSLLLFTSCDDHEAVDLGIHPGYILCDDGVVMSDQAFFAQDFSGKNYKFPAAVIFTEQLNDSEDMARFLAVSIKELPQLQFCDSISMSQGTNTDVTVAAGNTNTTALQNSYDTKLGHGSPLADYVFAHSTYGQSDFIPSVKELKMLYAQKGRVNAVLQRINEHLAGSADLLFTEARSDSCWYWSSTEVAANPMKQAWIFSMSSGTPQECPKIEAHAARAIVPYYPYNQ